MIAIDTIIRGHDDPRRTVAHGNAKALEIDLSQGALCYVGRIDHTGGLLIIDRKVLDLRADAR